jgi:hypothetical protein
METVIKFYPGEASNVFALAAALKAGYKIIPVPSMMEIWSGEVEKSFSEKTNNSEEILLLDIYADNPNFPDLDIYLKMQGPKIKGITNTQDLQSMSLSSTKYQGIYRFLNYFAGQMAADARDLRREQTWLHNKVAERYGRALRAATIKAYNTANKSFYGQALIDCALEIASKKRNSQVDDLVNGYLKGKNEDLATAKAKFSTSGHPFVLPSRTVAFAYLDNISGWLDLYTLGQEIRRLYPYLAIIQYRKNNKEYNWIISDGQVNVRQLLNLGHLEGDAYQVLIKLPHKVATKKFSREISDLNNR